MITHSLIFNDKRTAIELFLPIYQLLHHLTRDEPSLVVRLRFFNASSKVQANNVVEIDNRAATVPIQSTDKILYKTTVFGDIMEEIIPNLAVLEQFHLTRLSFNLIVSQVLRITVNRKCRFLEFIDVLSTHHMQSQRFL